MSDLPAAQWCALLLYMLKLCLALPLLFAVLASSSLGQAIIPGPQLIGDIKILRSALEQIHPELYRYTTKADLDRSFDSLANDVRGGMDEAHFLTSVTEIAVKVHCGHTFVNLMNQKDAGLDRMFNKKTFIPLYFRLLGTRMIVTENVSDDSRLIHGTEILKINGVPVKRVLQDLLKISKADGLHNTAHRLRSLEVQREPGEVRNYTNLFDVYYPQLFPMTSSTYNFKAQNLVSGKTFVATVPSVTKADRITRAEVSFGRHPEPESAWQFRFLDAQTGYMKLAAFFTYGWKLDTAAFYKDAFAQMQRAHAKSLIIDLRGNVGGLVQNATELERYISSPVSYRVPQQRTVIKCLQVSKEVSPFLMTYEGDIGKLLTTGLSTEKMKHLPEGGYEIVSSSSPEAPATPTEHFTGRVYFLADATNASATSELLARVRLNKLGTIVGEQTAGNQQGINVGTFFLRLPASKVEIDIPALALLPITAEPDGGVPPHVRVQQRPEDIAAGKDTQLEVAIRLARR